MRTDDAGRERAVDTVRDLNFTVLAFRESVAAHFGVGVREAEAVTHLVAHGHLGAGDLGRLVDLSPATVTHLIGRLQRAGLATTASDPADLRRNLVVPTDRAYAMIREIRGWLGDCLDAFDDLDVPAETVVAVLATLRDGLDQVRDRLRAAGSPPSGRGTRHGRG